MPTVRLGAAFVGTVKPSEKPVIYYDSALTGFGLKVLPSGAKSWIAEYRPGIGGRRVAKKRVVIGSTSTLTAEQARRAAKDMLAAARVTADPATVRAEARAALTVSELADAFLEEHVRAKRKATTAEGYRIAIDQLIKPLLGAFRITELTRADVAKVHLAHRKRPYTANKALSVLGSMYSFADRRGLVPENTNPTRKIERFPEKSRERFLSENEFHNLGEALREAETVGIEWQPDPAKKIKHAPKRRRVVVDQYAIAAIRLLLLTGARLREILHLRWREWDRQRGLLVLPDSKTGRKTIVLNSAATAVLESLPAIGCYVIASESAGKKDERPRSDLNKPWRTIRRRAGLVDVRLHDLRHSFASVGAGRGLALPQIGALLGHSQPSTTQKYAHHGNAPLREAAEVVGKTIAAALGGQVDG